MVMFRLDILRLIAFPEPMIKHYAFLGLLALSVGACATPSPASDTPDQPTVSHTQRAMDNASSGVGEAASAPLKDFNLKRDKIPALLRTIRNPYDVDMQIECLEITLRVEALNAVLGRDWDVPPPDKKSLEERTADGASTAFLDALASEASGLIPYRGLVRTVSGANRHRKKVLKAYERGSHRRTFLKGLGLMKGCSGPAAPAPIEEDSKVVFK